MEGKEGGLLGGAVLALLAFVGTILAFVTKTFPAPAFSDFLFFPVLIFGIIVNFMAWRSSKQG